MARVEIGDEYVRWVEQEVVPAFANIDVEITESARTLLAFLLQSQRQQRLINQDALLLQNAGRFLAEATEAYLRMYGPRVMNTNRAIHVLVDVNLRLWIFPWGTSD